MLKYLLIAVLFVGCVKTMQKPVEWTVINCAPCGGTTFLMAKTILVDRDTLGGVTYSNFRNDPPDSFIVGLHWYIAYPVYHSDTDISQDPNILVTRSEDQGKTWTTVK
jgi:hypothetical protein